ncbi:MAG TPA: hypothetical protein VJI13_02895 [Candidatus Norongarragalinales archaeon]|nr:hypothetical protein [Candidatus Norongarragalinales archaeon]
MECGLRKSLLVAIPLLLLLLARDAQAIVIIPPVVYFVTLSIGTFISSSIVSLLIFGALKGFANRKYWGRSAFQLLTEAKSALSSALLAILSMVAAFFAVYPIDLESVVLASLIAAILFLLTKFVSSLRQYAVSDGAARRGLILSWLTIAIFIGLATSVSALVSMQSYRIFTGSGSYAPALEKEDALLEPPADILTGAKAPSSGMRKPAMVSDGKVGGQGAAAPEGKSGEEPAEGSADASALLPSPSPSAGAIANLWFIPKSGETCNIFADSYVQTFVPSFTCISEENGARRRIYCPVSISLAQMHSRGDVEFRGTGSCAGKITATITDNGFENVR